MAGDSQRVHAIELLPVSAATGDQEAPAPAPAVFDSTKIGREEEALRLVAQLGISLAPNLTGIPPATHKLAFKLRVAANLIAVSLDILLVAYLILIFSRRTKRTVSAGAKLLMWAALAATYVTFVVGVFIELLP
ncbi:hypothetical protein KSP39_PZI017361 [Platanthera zijinensis]|uniref:Uncharacterized protein n=1 Tax=Platanthera zijinensis TaxID=2320716 RepID=A0AAP0B5W4_9ASPA